MTRASETSETSRKTETERTGCVLVARCRPKRVHTACTPLPLACAIVAAGRFPAAIGWQNRDGGEICESPPVTHACVALQQVATSITEDAGGQLASITHPGARPSTVPAVRKHYLVIPDVCHYSCIMNQHHHSSLLSRLSTRFWKNSSASSSTRIILHATEQMPLLA